MVITSTKVTIETLPLIPYNYDVYSFNINFLDFKNLPSTIEANTDFSDKSSSHSYDSDHYSDDDNIPLVFSPEFTCFGHTWRLGLYPGGDGSEENEEEYGYCRNDKWVSVRLDHLSNRKIVIDFDIGVKNCGIQGEDDFEFRGSEGGCIMSYFMHRSSAEREAEDANGKLVIQVRMKQLHKPNNAPETKKKIQKETPEFEPAPAPTEPKEKILREKQLEMKTSLSPPPTEHDEEFIPPNPFRIPIQQPFNDEKSADIVFAVGYNMIKSNEGRKRSKITPPTYFHAHRKVLDKRLPKLALLCDQYKDRSPIPIKSIQPNVFGILLQYIYGESIPTKEMKSNSRKVLELANEFGAIRLKITAEVYYVDSTIISTDNVLDLLHFANAKNCALLKEAIVDYIFENETKVLQNVSFENIPGEIVSDLLAAVARGKKKSLTVTDNSIVDFNTTRVGTLRRMCYEKGLDLGGSRNDMIALLKNVHGKRA